MTPLAHEIAADLCRSPRERKIARLSFSLDEFHFFECSQVLDAAIAMTADEWGREAELSSGDLAFLPADKTWIEFKEGGARCAFALEINPDKTTANVRTILTMEDGRVVEDKDNHQIILKESLLAGVVGGIHTPLSSNVLSDCEILLVSRIDDRTTQLIYVLLAMINTPRHFGRRQHMPHRGLERRLRAARGGIGRFPLQAWTELSLPVGLPKDITAAPSAEAHFTGGRALHFVRRHMRVRNGMIEYVKPHWRGDAALGIKQTRYAVVPPKSGQPAIAWSA